MSKGIPGRIAETAVTTAAVVAIGALPVAPELSSHVIASVAEFVDHEVFDVAAETPAQYDASVRTIYDTLDNDLFRPAFFVGEGFIALWGATRMRKIWFPR